MLNSSGSAYHKNTTNSYLQALLLSREPGKKSDTTETVTSVPARRCNAFNQIPANCMNPRSYSRYIKARAYRPAGVFSKNQSGAFPF